MPRPQFTLRALLWLMAVVAILAALVAIGLRLLEEVQKSGTTPPAVERQKR